MEYADLVSDVSHYMNYLVTKRNTVSSNIANANTPGYKAQDVTFAEQMNKSSALYKNNAADLKSNPIYIKRMKCTYRQ